MTENELRQTFVNVMQRWVGLNEADGSHMKIINIYNGHKPLARSYKLTRTDAWCAATVSAAAIEAGLTDIIPTECSCTKMIGLLQQKKAWMEQDDYIPAPGDLIFYDWQDGKDYLVTDNKGAPDHVGVVEKVSGRTIIVIEGNYNDQVGRRNLSVNGRYIRGFGVPDYAGKAAAMTPAAGSRVLHVGDTVHFVGKRHYVNSYENAAGSTAKPCTAAVTLIREGQAHPYHLTGDSVYGWVDAADVEDVPTPLYTVEVHVTTRLNIRPTPSTEKDPVGWFENGDRVAIYEVRNNWGRIADGGWIALWHTERIGTVI